MKYYITGLLLLVSLAASACATRKDVDAMQEELASLREEHGDIQIALDSLQQAMSAMLTEQRELAIRTRGDVRNQLDDMERQLVEIQELLGQSQVVLAGLRRRIEGRQWQSLDTAAAAGGDSAAAAPGAAITTGGGDDPRSLYAAAIEQFRRGAYETARGGFEEFLVSFPGDELAPDVQYYIAETYKEEKDMDRAIREYRRVVELYPNSRAAPTALYKAGLIETEEDNKDQACQYFQRILAGYPRSDEARLARDQVQRLNCR